MNRTSHSISFSNRRFRIAFSLLYWLLAACLFVTFLFALIPSTMKELLEKQMQAPGKEIFSWTSSFYQYAEDLRALAAETEIEKLFPLLSDWEPFPCMSGGFYLMHRDGTVLSGSGLPTGHPQMLPRASYPVPCTIPYQRFSDGAFIVSFFYYIAPDWMLAADLSLERLSEFFTPFQKNDRFLFLIDSHTRQLMVHPDAGSGKSLLTEIDEPLLEPLLSAREIPKTALSAKNRQGKGFYLFAAEKGEWTLVYCQARASLLREMLFCYPDTISFLGAYLIVAGLAWLRIWLAIRPGRKEKIS